jgi:hypothetical protein
MRAWLIHTVYVTSWVPINLQWGAKNSLTSRSVKSKSVVTLCSAAFPLQMMEQLYHFDLVPRASLLRTGCTTARWGWGSGRRGYRMHFTTPWNPSYVILTLKCVYILIMFAMTEYFRPHFPCLFERQNMNLSVHSWWKKICDSKYHVWKKVLPFYNLVFPMWHVHQCSSCSSYSLVQEFRGSQWWGFIMQYGLGHHIVWYMVVKCFGGAV